MRRRKPFEHGGEVPGIDRLAVDRGLAAHRVEPGAMQKGRAQRMAGERLVEPGEAAAARARAAASAGSRSFPACRPQQRLEHFFHPRRTGAASAGAALRRPALPIRVRINDLRVRLRKPGDSCNSHVIRSDPLFALRMPDKTPCRA